MPEISLSLYFCCHWKSCWLGITVQSLEKVVAVRQNKYFPERQGASGSSSPFSYYDRSQNESCLEHTKQAQKLQYIEDLAGEFSQSTPVERRGRARNRPCDEYSMSELSLLPITGVTSNPFTPNNSNPRKATIEPSRQPFC